VKKVFSGCYTALVTPMGKKFEVDYECLRSLVDFQIEGGVNGILAVGTTGESTTLNWDEHLGVIERVHEHINGRCLTIAGTGSNCTDEAIEATKHSWDLDIRSVLLVDPYYNGPSSIEIRKEYIEPVATRFPEVQVIPYVIPGRTGTQLLPQDLAILHKDHQNIRAVKEATGNLENMELTRKYCGHDFDILSGDDNMTYEMMISRYIMANGVISVVSNIAPKAVSKMVQSIVNKKMERAARLYETLSPLFELVTVKTEENTPFGTTICRARNPLPYKTLMSVLGMASGPCRKPLGKLTRNGIEAVLAKTREVFENNPEIFEPLEKYFGVDLSKRLYDKKFWKDHYYD
jgi:4-hydroxy-tetrahydrodipicolinate synthase